MKQEGAPAGRSKTAQLIREAGIESKPRQLPYHSCI
ncbi:hypothetical protein [Candidatus Hamiltonella endosymbiont of Tuberolachnus salignus]